MELYFTRHGQTFANSKGIVQTWSDGVENQLNASGQAESFVKAQRVASLGLPKVYHSPLGRATSTARIISDRTGSTLHPDARLRDQCLGFFDGSTLAETEARFPAVFKDWMDARLSGDWSYVLPHGPELFSDQSAYAICQKPESLQAALTRARQAIDEIIAKDEPALIVSHSSITTALLIDFSQQTRNHLSRSALHNLGVTTAGLYRVLFGADASVAGLDYQTNSWVPLSGPK